jgi:molybdopterin-biosynthesis enzyme MoeA-like protein
LASALSRVNEASPEVAIGSYPRWQRDEAGQRHINLRLTFEASTVEAAEAARDQVLAAAPEGSVLEPQA